MTEFLKELTELVAYAMAYGCHGRPVALACDDDMFVGTVPSDGEAYIVGLSAHSLRRFFR